MDKPDMTQYFAGAALYGDDFNAEQVAAWFQDEAEGYADLGSKDSDQYAYAYHALNQAHGFAALTSASFKHVLGFGSAYGDELRPIAQRAEQITIIDPSSAFVRAEIFGKPARYVQPQPDGRLPLDSGSFDIATCLGVLHHVPNVSFVLSELARVLQPHGYLLLREPIISMGDWRQPRRGLTKRERGIPLPLLRAMVHNNGFAVVRETLCVFPLTPRLFSWRRTPPYNSPFVVALDAALCTLFRWNVNYHPGSTIQRFRPTSAFFVLRKKSPSDP